MTSVEFNNALEKYVKKTAFIFYDAAIYTYHEEYWSFNTTLGSTKFLEKKLGTIYEIDLTNFVC
jgi:hypothetical protein